MDVDHIGGVQRPADARRSTRHGNPEPRVRQLFAAGRQIHAHVQRIVGGAEGDRPQPVPSRAGNLVGVFQGRGAFDKRHEADRLLGHAPLTFGLAQGLGHPLNIHGFGRFWNNNTRNPRQDRGANVVRKPFRLHRVHTHPNWSLRRVTRLQGDRRPRRDLFRRRNAVLKVDDYGVRVGSDGLVHSIEPVRRNEQRRSRELGCCQHHLHYRPSKGF